MTDKTNTPEEPEDSVAVNEQLKPKKPPRLAPEGIRTFTVARQYDETGVSGEGVVIEGVTLATGQCVVLAFFGMCARMSHTRHTTSLNLTFRWGQRATLTTVT